MTHQYCALYRARNLANGKEYYGISVNPKKRWNHHKYVARTDYEGSMFAFAKALKKHGADAFEFAVLMEERGDDAVAKCQDAEMLVVEMANSQVPHGYNITAGGEGTNGRVYTPDQLAALKVRVKKQWADGREKMLSAAHSPEANSKRSVRSTEYNNRPEVIEAKRAASTEYHNRPEVKAARSVMSKEYANRPEVKARVSAWAKERNKLTCTPVVCSNGMFFCSISAARDWLWSIGHTKASISPLSKAASGKRKSKMAYGYHWRYAETNESLEKETA